MADPDINPLRVPTPPRVSIPSTRIRAFDTARYIAVPGVDFAQPYLSIPGGRAFVWPLGTEGFEVTDQAELGRHKYLGEITIDIDVTHKAETSITMSGVFPGWTGQENMQALRQIFFADTPPPGKILFVPGVLNSPAFVVGDNLRHSHSEDDMMMDIQYSATFVYVGTTGAHVDTGPTQPDQGSGSTNPKRGKRKFVTTSKIRTLRSIAAHVFSNPSRWAELYAIQKNAAYFNKHDVPAFQAPDYRLPIGMVIYF